MCLRSWPCCMTQFQPRLCCLSDGLTFVPYSVEFIIVLMKTSQILVAAKVASHPSPCFTVCITCLCWFAIIFTKHDAVPWSHQSKDYTQESSWIYLVQMHTPGPNEQSNIHTIRFEHVFSKQWIKSNMHLKWDSSLQMCLFCNIYYCCPLEPQCIWVMSILCELIMLTVHISLN